MCALTHAAHPKKSDGVINAGALERPAPRYFAAKSEFNATIFIQNCTCIHFYVADDITWKTF